jgi:hypothetical protein
MALRISRLAFSGPVFDRVIAWARNLEARSPYQRQFRLYRALRIRDPREWRPEPPVVTRLG